MRRTLALVLLGVVCLPAGARAEPAVPGPPVIAIEGFEYIPNGSFDPARAGRVTLWVQQVPKGSDVTVVNLEPTYPTYQHTATECTSPCRTATFPSAKSSGFDTGVIAYGGGTATIPSAKLTPGLHEYFCRLHPWMRGALQVA